MKARLALTLVRGPRGQAAMMESQNPRSLRVALRPKPQNQKPEKSEKDSNKGEEAKEDDDDRRSDSLPW